MLHDLSDVVCHECGQLAPESVWYELAACPYCGADQLGEGSEFVPAPPRVVSPFCHPLPNGKGMGPA